MIWRRSDWPVLKPGLSLVNGEKLMKCYDKHIDYIVPFFECNFCKRPIRQGEMLCSVILEWGISKSACLECYEKFEVNNEISD